MGRTWSWWGSVVGLVLPLPAFGQARESGALELGRGGRVEVGLHGRVTEASARSERAAWLTVSVPLDRAAVPRVAPPSVPTPAPVEPARERTASAPVSLPQVRSLAAFTRRATVVALSVVGTAAERRRLDSLAARARTSALLPEVRFRVLRNSDKALRWIPSTDDPYRITQADGTGLVLEGAVTFRLDRLVFANEELAVERLRADVGAARLKLEARIVDALVGLFRAREQSCADAGETPDRPARLLEVVQLFAELDALTAGWFSEAAPELGRAVWGFPDAVLGACAPPPSPSPPSPRPDRGAGGGDVAATFAVASDASSE